ncbi:hypothetical protein SDC9_107374 [bioreactor metagenome]|uniref:Uncharacterized protein n=1 Tax=bioreactor metagenome TaxID=1076179 RepID=A0A645BBG2_9ZZZZ
MRVIKFWKFGENFHHLVSTFTTGSDNNNIGLRLFGNGVLQHRFPSSESAGYKSGSAFHNRVQCIYRSHAGFQQFKRPGFFLVQGNGHFHRPFLNHVQFMLLPVFIFNHRYGVVNVVLSFRCDTFHLVFAGHHERDHYLVGLEILIHFTQP